jgi:hypothetical protein
MRSLYRLLVYCLVTAVVEGVSFAVLYSNGYPGHLSGVGGSVVWIALNIVFYYIAISAIGGPKPGMEGEWIYNPVVQVIGGIIGMFVMVTVVGESLNWIGERIMEKSGRNEPRRFKRQVDSAIHEFVKVTYSSKSAQAKAEAGLIELYSSHPEQAMGYLREVLERIKSSGDPNTAIRVEALIKQLEFRAKTQYSSGNVTERTG